MNKCNAEYRTCLSWKRRRSCGDGLWSAGTFLKCMQFHRNENQFIQIGRKSLVTQNFKAWTIQAMQQSIAKDLNSLQIFRFANEIMQLQVLERRFRREFADRQCITVPAVRARLQLQQHSGKWWGTPPNASICIRRILRRAASSARRAEVFDAKNQGLPRA